MCRKKELKDIVTLIEKIKEANYSGLYSYSDKLSDKLFDLITTYTTTFKKEEKNNVSRKQNI